MVYISDYAIAVFHEALKSGKYECYLKPDTRLPMMYIEDCLRSLWEYMTTPEDMLRRRVYNVTAMSFSPEELVKKLAEYIPNVQVSYNPDSRQEIGKYNLKYQLSNESKRRVAKLTNIPIHLY